MVIEIKKAEQNQIEANMRNSFSSHEIPLLLPQEADPLDASVVDQKLNGLHINSSKVNQEIPCCFQNSKVEPMKLNGFVDDHDFLNGQTKIYSGLLGSGMKASDEWQETEEHSYNAVSADETGQVGPRVSCRCQVRGSSSNYIIYICNL